MSELIFVSFKRELGKPTAYVPVDYLLSGDKDMETILKMASDLYERFFIKVQAALAEINDYRTKHILLPARSVWRLGNVIFEFVNSLSNQNLQIDGLYEHMERDFKINRKWLVKVIILRRYIPTESHIPETINWGHFEKGTRRKAEELMRRTS